MKADPIVWQLLLQLCLIMLNAVFACAEIAVISVNEKKLEKLAASGDRRAKRLLALTAQPARFLSVIQVGITLAGFLGSAFAADNFAARLTAALTAAGAPIPAATLNTLSVIAITLILSYFTLILGELVPKRIAQRRAEQVALKMSGFIYAISRIFAPVVWLLTASTNGLLRLLGIDPHAQDEAVTEEEIRLMVDAGSEKGAIDLTERTFIHNLFDFDDRTAVELMTPRTDVDLLWMEDSLEQWDQIIRHHVHSVYLVCNDDVDDVVGVLYTKDYFRLPQRTREAVEACIKPAYFVPETLGTDVLLRNMQQSRTHFAVVVDEYGGTSGIITINDLLEQLVGDLDELSDETEPPDVESVEQGVWRVQGSAPLEVVSAALGVYLPDDDYETFGGLALDLLDTIPADGSTPEMTGHGLVIQVLEIRERRLIAALVRMADTVGHGDSVGHNDEPPEAAGDEGPGGPTA